MTSREVSGPICANLFLIDVLKIQGKNCNAGNWIGVGVSD